MCFPLCFILICKISHFWVKDTASDYIIFRGGSRNVATSKMECFVIIVNGRKPLTIITKHSLLDVAAVLDPSLILFLKLDTLSLLKVYIMINSLAGVK